MIDQPPTAPSRPPHYLAWPVRRVTVTPSMCGQTSLLAARIGDWTWETVSQQCGLDVLRATTTAGLPTYLAFHYVRLRGSDRMPLHTPGFGDPLTVHSQAFDFGGESVLTLHRLAPGDGTGEGTRQPPDPDEFWDRPRPDCLYAETFNRWICRSRPDSNATLVSASPVGFTHRHLPRLPERYSPRPLTRAARHRGSLLDGPPPGTHLLSPPFTTDHQVDPVRDLNGVGLVYFAAYFAIIDAAVLAYWRHLGRSDAAFLQRRVTDQQLCYFGNVDTDTTMRISVRAHTGPAAPQGEETLDIDVRERATGRLLAVCAIRLQGSKP
ncbi:MAG: biosynthesis cluster domain-containing protein [Streptomyces sp.]|nr:biosynthesis cluster domain-containing protein [Streptomyces sp.]NUT29786.1 biosynthesis cluster domain-containing protein [Streptomyces sp.]